MANLEYAVLICKELELIAPNFGIHIGLTGGCLYKESDRKDLDIILYRIRQVETPDLEDFYAYLVSLGWQMAKLHGWVQKMVTPDGTSVDFFYPELTPTEEEEEYFG